MIFRSRRIPMTPSLVRAAIAALILAALPAPGIAQTPSVKFTLDFAIQGQQSPFVLAADGGYFSRAGVNVQVDRGYGSADTITKVASGAYDMAFADHRRTDPVQRQAAGRQGHQRLPGLRRGAHADPVAEEVEHRQAHRPQRQAHRLATRRIEPRDVPAVRRRQRRQSRLDQLDRRDRAIARDLAGAGSDRRHHRAGHRSRRPRSASASPRTISTS